MGANCPTAAGSGSGCGGVFDFCGPPNQQQATGIDENASLLTTTKQATTPTRVPREAYSTSGTPSRSEYAAPSTPTNRPMEKSQPMPTTPTERVPASTYANYHQQSKSGFFSKYELKQDIALGSTSKCYRCTRKSDGKEFACKVIDKRHIEAQYSAGMLDQCTVEIKVLKTLKHANIIALEDNYESSDRIYMVMELMAGGELFDYVSDKGTLSEEEASIIVRKITSAVAHMHSMSIIHRDLKPENLLLSSKGPEAEVKLIDFGLAKIVDPDAVAKSFLGTKGYLAPEMLQRHAYDKAVDMWALGVIVFILICGCLPFDDDSSRITSESAARKKFTLRFPKWASNLSASAKDLLHNLLDVNPKTRFTADQALNHPWVSGRTVQPNNYLQSPRVIGERRRELRTPVMSAAPAPATRLNLDPIKEEASHQRGPKGERGERQEFGGGGPRELFRKNSM